MKIDVELKYSISYLAGVHVQLVSQVHDDGGATAGGGQRRRLQGLRQGRLRDRARQVRRED